MSECVFSPIVDGKTTCGRCGVPLRTRAADASKLHRRCTKSGLGDKVASTLAAVGITKKRYAKLRGLKDCGCDGRQQWLNDKGYQWSMKTRKFLNRFSID